MTPPFLTISPPRVVDDALTSVKCRQSRLDKPLVLGSVSGYRLLLELVTVKEPTDAGILLVPSIDRLLEPLNMVSG